MEYEMNPKQINEERKIIIACMYGELVLGNDIFARKYAEMLKELDSGRK